MMIMMEGAIWTGMLQAFWQTANASALSTAESQTLAALEEVRATLGLSVPVPFPTPDQHAETLWREVRWFAPTAEAMVSDRRVSVSAGSASEAPGEVRFLSRPVWRHRDILRQMDQAVSEKWSLLEFGEWLVKEVGKNPEREFLSATFFGAVDQEVLTKKREKPRVRPTLLEIENSLRHPADRSTLHRWTNHWRLFAVSLNEQQAIRPLSTTTLNYLERFQKGKMLEGFFKQSSSSPDNSLELFNLLTTNYFINEALVAANILVGIHDGERLPVRQLSLEGLTGRGTDFMEGRLELLARRYGFTLKEKL